MSQTMTEIMDMNGFFSFPDVPPEASFSSSINCTVLRDPIERFISAYIMLICDQRHNKDTDGFKDSQLTPETLRRFIHLLEKSFFNGHLHPQVESLPVKIDYYLLQENIDADFKKLPFKIDLPLGDNGRIKVKNSQNESDKKLVRKQLTPILISKLKKIYNEDFKLYAKCRTYGSKGGRRG